MLPATTLFHSHHQEPPMKTFAALAFAVLFATAASAKTTAKAAPLIAAAAKAGEISCTTPGDAMGSITLKITTTIEATEYGMDDSITKYGKAQIIPGGAELSAVKAGKPANFWFKTKKSN